jgi:hydroxymethylbilane synthase
LYPKLLFKDVRGNLNTRLAKLDAVGGPYAGLILAYAGLKRLGFVNRVSEKLDMYYAVGQAAIAVQCREGDAEVREMLGKLDCVETLIRCSAERAFMRVLVI